MTSASQKVHRIRVADHHRERGRQVEDVVRRRSVHRLAGSHAVAVVGELGRLADLGDFCEPVAMIVVIAARAIRRQVAVVISGIGHASSESSGREKIRAHDA